MNNAEIYRDNIESLKKNYPQLARDVESVQLDNTIRVSTSKSGMPVIGIDINGQFINLESTEDPRKEAYAYVYGELSESIKKPNIIVLMGLGTGYMIEALVAKYGQFNPYIVVIENDLRLFKQYIQVNKPMVNLGPDKQISIFEYPGVKYCVGVPADKIYSALFADINRHSRSVFSTFYYVEHPKLIRFNKEYYKPIMNEIKRVCYDVRSSFGNDPEDSWFGIDNMLLNAKTISENAGVKETYGQFKGVPAVIVATGPSLNNNIHLLPKIKGKCVFFAADASVNTFFNYADGPIMPDIVCSLERNLTTQKHFRQIPEEKKHLMKDIYLGACPVVKPQLIDAWHGKHMVIYRDFAHFKWLNVDKGILNTGKSVTNMAFQVAYAMGCDPIILVGQDLAFAPSGETHVKGANHASSGLKASPLMQQKTKVMGNNGQMLESLDTWVGMLRRFELDIANQPDRTYINATEGGALIKGTQIKTLQECIDTYMTEDVNAKDKLDVLLEKPSKEQAEKDFMTITEQVKKGSEYLDFSLDIINKVLKNLEEGFKFIDDVGPNMDELNLILEYADKAKYEILTHEMCYYTIMHVIQSWLMGRDNVFSCIQDYYSDEEYAVAKFIRVFEFMYGLKILYEHVQRGINESFKL